MPADRRAEADRSRRVARLSPAPRVWFSYAVARRPTSVLEAELGVAGLAVCWLGSPSTRRVRPSVADDVAGVAASSPPRPGHCPSRCRGSRPCRRRSGRELSMPAGVAGCAACGAWPGPRRLGACDKNFDRPPWRAFRRPRERVTIAITHSFQLIGSVDPHWPPSGDVGGLCGVRSAAARRERDRVPLAYGVSGGDPGLLTDCRGQADARATWAIIVTTMSEKLTFWPICLGHI